MSYFSIILTVISAVLTAASIAAFIIGIILLVRSTPNTGKRTAGILLLIFGFLLSAVFAGCTIAFWIMTAIGPLM